MNIDEEWAKEQAEDKARERKWWADVNASLARTKARKEEEENQRRLDLINSYEVIKAKFISLIENITRLSIKRDNGGLTPEEASELLAAEKLFTKDIEGYCGVFTDLHDEGVIFDMVQKVMDVKRKAVGLTAEEDALETSYSDYYISRIMEMVF